MMSVSVFAPANVAAEENEKTNATVKMTYVDYNNPTTAIGLIEENNTAKSGYNKISGGKVEFGQTGWGVNYVTFINVDASAITDNIVKVTLTAEFSGSTDNKRVTVWGVGYNDSEWSEKLTYEAADRSITTLGGTVSTTTNNNTVFETLNFDITDALANDDDRIVTILIYETAAAGGYIKNPKVEVEHTSEALTGYTVKFQDQVGNEIKTAATYSGFEIGTQAQAPDDDLASFFNNDNTIKYIYESGNNAIDLVEEAASNVITLVFREAGKFNYKLQTNGGDEMASGQDFEGETVNVNYPRYIYADGKLSSAAKGTAGWYLASFELTADNQVETVTYTDDVDNVVYYSEAEDIETLTLSTATYSDIRCSNGKCAYNASGADAVITTLSAGKYTLSSSVWGTKDMNFTFKRGDGAEIMTLTTTGSIVDGTSAEFEVKTEGTETIYLTSTTSVRSGIDFVYITKTGEATGIADVEADGAAADDTLYDLMGRKVQYSKGLKGIYIRNGKKVMFK